MFWVSVRENSPSIYAFFCHFLLKKDPFEGKNKVFIFYNILIINILFKFNVKNH